MSLASAVVGPPVDVADPQLEGLAGGDGDPSDADRDVGVEASGAADGDELAATSGDADGEALAAPTPTVTEVSTVTLPGR